MYHTSVVQCIQPGQVVRTPGRHGLIRRQRNWPRVCKGTCNVVCMSDHQSTFELEQKAVVRACRNAIEFNSIPCVEKLVPGGRKGLKLKIKIGTPLPDTIDLNEVKKVFPYGQTCFEVVLGGLCCQSGVAIAELGDKNDDMLIAVAAVTVGY